MPSRTPHPANIWSALITGFMKQGTVLVSASDVPGPSAVATTRERCPICTFLPLPHTSPESCAGKRPESQPRKTQAPVAPRSPRCSLPLHASFSVHCQPHPRLTRKLGLLQAGKRGRQGADVAHGKNHCLHIIKASSEFCLPA